MLKLSGIISLYKMKYLDEDIVLARAHLLPQRGQGALDIQHDRPLALLVIPGGEEVGFGVADSF
jgi:hypothetical protein